MSTLAIILGWAATCALVLAVLIFAALGSPWWSIGSAVLAVWIVVGTLRICEIRKNNRDWHEATKPQWKH